MATQKYTVGPNVEVIQFTPEGDRPYTDNGDLRVNTAQPQILSFWQFTLSDSLEPLLTVSSDHYNYIEIHSTYIGRNSTSAVQYTVQKITLSLRGFPATTDVTAEVEIFQEPIVSTPNSYSANLGVYQNPSVPIPSNYYPRLQDGGSDLVDVYTGYLYADSVAKGLIYLI
jgi:hypothetical protein